MKDAVLIVDHYQLSQDAGRRHLKLDPDRYAQGLGLMSRPLGRDVRRIAIVEEGDAASAAAYQKARFEIVAMNGSRPSELPQFIGEMDEFIDHAALKRLVVASTDPTFSLLCTWARKKGTEVSVWAPKDGVPAQLREHNYQPLEELLPDLKVPRIDIRLDYENLHFGLVERGWSPDTRALVAAIKAEAATLGEVVSIVAYADWTLLSKSANRDVQRELALEGVETRYQVNLRGKNSADMKMADDIAALTAQDPNASDSVDLIILGTCDRDFRPTVERVKSRGKRLVIFALENGTSWQLRDAAEVRYLDHRLMLGRPARPDRPSQDRVQRPASDQHPLRSQRPLPWDEHAALLVQVIAWLQRRSWKWGFTDQIAAEAGLGPDAALRLDRAAEAGVFTRRTLPSGQEGAARQTLMPNPAHSLVPAAKTLCTWIPGRVRYCLKEKGMPYIDSHYLANGMANDRNLQQLGVAQTRPEADGWLDLAAQAGLVIKKSQANPKGPGTIHTWWLPEAPSQAGQASHDPAPSEPPGPEPARPAGPAGLGQGQASGPAASSPYPTQSPAREPKASPPQGRGWPGGPFESPQRPVSQAS
jgi:uncharacterized LabA/DUF88 family protein